MVLSARTPARVGRALLATPGRAVVASFAVAVAVSTLLLSLPIATQSGEGTGLLA